MNIEFSERDIICVNRDGFLKVYDLSIKNALIKEKTIEEQRKAYDNQYVSVKTISRKLSSFVQSPDSEYLAFSFCCERLIKRNFERQNRFDAT